MLCMILGIMSKYKRSRGRKIIGETIAGWTTVSGWRVVFRASLSTDPDIVGLSYPFAYRSRHDDEPAGLGTMLIFLLIDGHMP